MKAVVIAFILLGIILGGVCLNRAYIKKVTEQLKSLVQDVSEGNEPDKALGELSSLWENSKAYIALSVELDQIDRVTEYVIKLSAAYYDGDEQGTKRLCSLLYSVIDDVARYEKLSIINIF